MVTKDRIERASVKSVGHELSIYRNRAFASNRELPLLAWFPVSGSWLWLGFGSGSSYGYSSGYSSGYGSDSGSVYGLSLVAFGRQDS